MASQDDLWSQHYEELMQFVSNNKRRPSKHRLEDHKMLCWIKYNKKMYARGKLSEERMKKFDEYLALADKYRRYNTRTYANPSVINEGEPNLFTVLVD